MPGNDDFSAEHVAAFRALQHLELIALDAPQQHGPSAIPFARRDLQPACNRPAPGIFGRFEVDAVPLTRLDPAEVLVLGKDPLEKFAILPPSDWILSRRWRLA